MNTKRMKNILAIAVAAAMLSTGITAPTWAQPPRMKMTTDIPEAITTPDRVETRIGTLEFFDGIPTKETSQLVYDHLDFSRAKEAFLNGIPAASIEGLRRGAASLGANSSNQVLYFDKLMDSKALFLTGNTSTVYCSPFLDLKKDGPTVVEIPAGAGPGTVNDAYFRFVIDMGAPGPDRGQGGKYLILPPDYEGDLDGPIGGKAQVVDGETYFVAKSTSYVNWVALRGFLVDGKPDAAAKMWRDGLKIYPLALKANPPKMEFISGSGKSFNTIHANNFKFYEELHTVIEREPVEMLDPELRGLFASIGIEKGKPFAPDARMKKIMTEAVAVANATSRALLWDERNKDEFLYEGSYWKRGYPGDNYQFLKDEGLGGRNLDARTSFYYFATVNTPAMAMKLIGAGSQYAWGYLDSKGNYLDGSKTYKLNIPKDAPAKKFWSVCVYDPQTRSMLQTDQTFPSKQSQRDKLIANDDGSIGLYFGPKAPVGKEANWTQTVPGKGWFCLLRLYSPTEPWFHKTWRPGEIELVK
ncbi:MAG: DUF1254 domain-containing protein [Planctomycetaceae bacterium]|jgi:hypothetical protein|nr:DUF1254 domain-containing protein [Planctomycetaceae bacterium]